MAKKVVKKRIHNLSTGRDYSRDKAFQSTKTQKKRRAGRNAARRKMIKSGRVRVGDKKDIDHKNGNTLDNSAKNLRVMSRSKNRSKK